MIRKKHLFYCKTKRMKHSILLWIFIHYALIAFAQGPPITTDTPVMLGLNGNGIRTFGKFIAKENANIYIQPIGIPYNISTTFQLGGIFPLKFITPNNTETTGGLADITLFAKYQLYKKDGTAKTFRILATARQSFPTGNTHSLPAIGSGLYQTYLGLIIGQISSKIGIYGDFGYNVTSHNVTDNVSYNFSVGTPLLPQQYPQKQVNIFLEFNGNYVIDPKVHTLFVSPGLQFILGRRVLFETSFQLPVLQQNITINQTKYMFLLGTRFLIN